MVSIVSISALDISSDHKLGACARQGAIEKSAVQSVILSFSRASKGVSAVTGAEKASEEIFLSAIMKNVLRHGRAARTGGRRTGPLHSIRRSSSRSGRFSSPLSSHWLITRYLMVLLFRPFGFMPFRIWQIFHLLSRCIGQRGGELRHHL
jgi:hypothetical protein